VQLQILVFLSNNYNNAKTEYSNRVSQYKYWSGVAGQFPNIPDILYNASLFAFQAGRKIEAINYIERAIKIDPLFKDAYRLKEEILKM
jgi:tetratricopeptide (TPR) repeat protein